MTFSFLKTKITVQFLYAIWKYMEWPDVAVAVVLFNSRFPDIKINAYKMDNLPSQLMTNLIMVILTSNIFPFAVQSRWLNYRCHTPVRKSISSQSMSLCKCRKYRAIFKSLIQKSLRKCVTLMNLLVIKTTYALRLGNCYLGTAPIPDVTIQTRATLSWIGITLLIFSFRRVNSIVVVIVLSRRKHSSASQQEVIRKLLWRNQ